MKKKIRAFFDTETTGLDFLKDRIVQLGVIIADKETVYKEYEQCINPQIKQDYQAVNVHGLTDERLAKEPVFKKVYQAFLDVLLKYDISSVVIHNADFDCTMISQELHRLYLAGENYLDYVVKNYPDFIPEKNRQYYFEDGQYKYTGKTIKETHNGEFLTFFELFPIEDTMLLNYNFINKNKGTLDVLAEKFNVDRTKRSKHHGALVDAEIMCHIYQKMEDGFMREIDFADMQRNIKGLNKGKLVVADEDRVEPSLAGKLVSLADKNKNEPNSIEKIKSPRI